MPLSLSVRYSSASTRSSAAIFGAIAYRFVLAFAMNLGMDSNYTKLFSACIVALAISLPAIKKYITKAYKRVCSDK